MKISIDETKVYDLKDFVARAYVSKKDNRLYSALFVDCKKRHYKTKLTGATRLYFVIHGKGTFIVNGSEQTAKPYDLFLINSGDSYEYKGKMKLIEINVPATDDKNEKMLE